MIEVINKLINILVGSSDVNYILSIPELETSYFSYIFNLNAEAYMTFDAVGFEGVSILFDYKVFFQWIFSRPEVIISFVFYLLMAWAVFYFCLIVPYRFIKSLLPKAIRGGKK